jgi:hypothetical protein
MMTFQTAFLRGALSGALALLAVGTVGVQRASSQSFAPASTASFAVAPVPFAVGEELTFKASFAGIRAGTARMKVVNIENVRGRAAYHIVFTIDGGIPLFRVRDRYESWIDVQSLSSLRHIQQISEGGYHRNTTYEIYPERALYQKDGGALQPSVARPLDDGSFIYAIRADMPSVGETQRDDRYFRPDRNPVVLKGMRHESVEVGAGRFSTTVIHPSIKANGIFSDNGDAQVWFTDDANRYPVLVKSKFSKFSLTLELLSARPGDRAMQVRQLADVVRGH